MENYYFLMSISDNDGEANLYRLDMASQPDVIKVMEKYPEDPKTALEHSLGYELIPELKKEIQERWGICVDYTWDVTGSTWYLVEKLYNHKITFSGKYAIFPGVTLISFCQDMEVCKKVREYLESTELSKYYRFLPELSYHITIHNIATRIQFGQLYDELLSKIGHGMVDWNSNRWKDMPENYSMTAAATEIYFRETMGVHYKFEGESAFLAQNTRDLCQTKFRLPQDKTPYHLTLGYKYSLEMPPKDLVEEVGRNVIEILGQTMKISLPVFCQFESMTEYEPIVN